MKDLLEDSLKKINNFLIEEDLLTGELIVLISEVKYDEYYKGGKINDWREEVFSLLKKYQDNLHELYDYLTLPVNINQRTFHENELRKIEHIKSHMLKLIDLQLHKIKVLLAKSNPNVILRMFITDFKSKEIRLYVQRILRLGKTELNLLKKYQRQIERL